MAKDDTRSYGKNHEHESATLWICANESSAKTSISVDGHYRFRDSYQVHGQTWYLLEETGQSKRVTDRAKVEMSDMQ